MTTTLSAEIEQRHEHAALHNVCANCGAPVSKRFARVFGDNSDVVWACHGCSPRDTIRAGGCTLSVRASARYETEVINDDEPEYIEGEPVVDEAEAELLEDEEYSFY
jgi:ribosomal protein L37AE/L43A